VSLQGARPYFAPNSCGGGASKGLSGKFEGGATGDRVFGFVFFGIWLGGHGFFLAEIPPWRKNKRFLARAHEKPFLVVKGAPKGYFGFSWKAGFYLAEEYLFISIYQSTDSAVNICILGNCDNHMPSKNSHLILNVTCCMLSTEGE